MLQKINEVSAKCGAQLKTVAKSTLLKTEKIAIIPSDNPKSPTRFTNIAFIEALDACSLVNQKFIKR